ncbi:protein of unknown function [Micropruina glycogenica]|uniref:Uncharacterized protein n=1 Tax=Micropruina glycogenica TaxID=75385 RepID=A0A2N9JDX2_9ACTN|nr:protein of unknown function [Micropruina glycogenica]
MSETPGSRGSRYDQRPSIDSSSRRTPGSHGQEATQLLAEGAQPVEIPACAGLTVRAGDGMPRSLLNKAPF